jgi:hypothetical protein
LSKKTFEAAAAANAHLIVQLKDNQPTLRQDVEAACNKTLPDAAPAVVGTEWEPYVAAVIQVERSVKAFQPATGLWKISDETSFYLSNRLIDANHAAVAIRKHWGIEN